MTPVLLSGPRVCRDTPMARPPYGVRNPTGGATSALPMNDVMLASAESPGRRAPSPSKFRMRNQVDEIAAPHPWFQVSVGDGRAANTMTSPAAAGALGTRTPAAVQARTRSGAGARRRGVVSISVLILRPVAFRGHEATPAQRRRKIPRKSGSDPD